MDPKRIVLILVATEDGSGMEWVPGPASHGANNSNIIMALEIMKANIMRQVLPPLSPQMSAVDPSLLRMLKERNRNA